jgi:hypothetical protein
MITGLFMGWTDLVSKEWFPIKKMTWNDGKYYTVYLQGMLAAMEVSAAHRTLVKSGLAKLDRVKITDDIHVSFKTRMPVNRPFTSEWRLRRLGLSTDLTQFEPFEYVARSGGGVGGDTSDLFPEVTCDEAGIYHFYFGIGNIEGNDISEYIKKLEANDLLKIKNGLIYDDENFLLGTAPGYISDIDKHHPNSIELTISKINHDIYNGGKLLCHISIDSKNIIPFSDPHYQPLVDIFAPIN